MSGPSLQHTPLHGNAGLRRIEAEAARALGGAFVPMQRAGLAAWHGVLAHWPQARRIVVACGPGNNGGDGYVLARHAQEAGREVRVVRLPSHAPRGELARRAEREYHAAGGRTDEFGGALPEAHLVVDALFGIGLSRAPDADAAALVEAMNAFPAPVFALDVPSGVDADSGRVHGAAVHAARTLQFIAAHPGLATGAALEYAGARDIATLDLSQDILQAAQPVAHVLVAADLRVFLPPRRRNAHKGDGGRVLCVGGDHGKGGAILLCAEAALRCGAGLVDVATRTTHVPAVLARRPEAMVHGVESEKDLEALLATAGVVAIGPGLGQQAWGNELYAAALGSGKPLVVDADALNLLASAPLPLPGEAVITPHPGEAARLLGVPTVQVQEDRFAAARGLCERYGCAVVLKGAGTVVAAPGAVPRVIAAGNPGMAVSGMGDVLTGVVAALRAQGLPAFDAASAGALLHAAAGDAAAGEGGERGLLPSDLSMHLRRLGNP